jgi:hypothetical protein
MGTGGNKERDETMATLIDGRVNLTEICEQAQWHRATAIDGVMAAGIGRRDAEAFVSTAFAEYAILHGGTADDPDSFLTDEQWDRLSEV